MYADLIGKQTTAAARKGRVDAETSALDNSLVHQKDALIRMMNDAVDWADVARLEEAGRTLAILTPVWEATSYGYKVRELRQRLSDCAWLVKVNLETAAQAHHRKGSKTYADMMARAARARASPHPSGVCATRATNGSRFPPTPTRRSVSDASAGRATG